MTLNDYDADIGDLHIAAGVPGAVADEPWADIGAQALTIAQHKEVVFIENDVPDYQMIAAQTGAGREVIILDAAGDGLQQMARALQGRSGIDALHVITHGAEGKLDLGTLALDSTTAAERGSLLASIGASLAPHGDILLYGCDVAAGQGASFVDQLAIATGADVAASSNPTGAASLGGDWNLEVTHGSIETAPVVDAALAAQYHELLAITNKTVQFKDGSTLISYGTFGPTADLTYHVATSYDLKFDGDKSGVGSYGYRASLTSYISFSPSGTEDQVTISFVGGQVFTPTAVDLNEYSSQSASQYLTITGKDSHGGTIASTNVHVLDGGTIDNFSHFSLAGFNNISSLVITKQGGGNIAYFQMDNLVLADAHVPGPAITSISSTTVNGTYKAGDVIALTVQFDQSVTVNTTGGTPTLTLETGTTDENAQYASGSGSNTLTFNYTVQAGDTSADLDYFSTAALALNGGTITATTGGVDATLTLPSPGGLGSLGANRAIVIDTTAPSAPSTPDLTAGTDLGTSSSDNLTSDTTPTFSGTAEAGSTVKLYDGATLVGTATANSGNYSITSSALANGSHTLTATATDAAGNVSAASAGLAVTVDTVAPTITIASNASALKAGETATITFTFSEDPGATFTWDGSSGDVTVSGGTLSAISGSGLTRTATFTPTANTNTGSASISVAAASYTDAAGNNGGAGTAATFGYDTKAPTLAIASDKATLHAGETATITFTFSEDPGATFTWDGSAGDVAVSGGTLSAISGTGTTRTAVFTPDANTNGGTAGITVGAGAYTDAAGNTGGAGSTPSISFDTLAPAAPSTPHLATVSDTGASSSDGITNATTPTFTGTAEAGATVTLYDTDGTTVLGSAVATGGNWSISAATLSEGTHTITAKVTDAAGNAGAVSSGVSVTIDTTAPAAPSAPVPDAAVTSNTTPTFTGTAEAGAHVKLYDTDGTTLLGTTTADGSGAWTITASSMGEGAHTVTAKATDVAGNTSVASTSHGVTIDTTAPAASSTPVLDPGSDTGTSSSDGITADTMPTFTGTAEAGATVKLYEGTTLLGSTVATGGIWSITSAALGEGAHTVTTTVTDAAGNVSGASGGLTVTVDLTAPTTTIDTAAFSTDSGTSGTDFVTNVAAQTIHGTIGTALQADERVEVSLDNGANWTAAQVSGTTWSLATTLGGSGTLQVRVADAVDNVGPAVTHAYVLDTSAPTVAISSDAGALKIGETATLTFTFSEDPGATFTWDGSAGDVAVSGGTLGALSGTGTTRTAVFTPDTNTNGGKAGITVGAGSYADAAGNTGGAGSTPSISFDTLAPAAPSTPHLAAGSDSGTSSSDGITNATTPTFTGTAEAGATVTLYDTDGTTVLGSTVATGGNWSISAATLSEGTHTITAKVTDAAGNAGAVSSGVSVTIDTTAPAAPSAPVPDAGVTNDTTPTFTGTAAAGAHVDLYDTNGTTILGSATADGSGAWTITASSMGEGAHTVTVKAVDVAGNTSVASVAHGITIDATAPAASSTPVLDPGSDTGTSSSDGITADTTPTFTGTAEAGATVKLYEGTTLLGSTVATGGIWSITSAALGEGAHTVTTTVLDAAGNVSGASSGLTVTVDLTAPTTTVDTVAFSADSGTSGTDFVTNVAAQTIHGTIGAALQADERVEVSLDNGANWTAAQVSGTTWSLATTLGGSGALQVRVADAVDNVGPAVTHAYVLDTSAPTVAISSDAGALKIGETATLTFTFSEDPGATFTAGDVAVSGGTLGALSGTGTTRTAVFTPDTNTNGGTAGITIAAGAYTDAAGNSGGAGSTPSITFDTLVPTAPAVQLQAASDSGASSADGITSDTTPTVNGTAEAHAAVTLYDGDGTTVLGTTTADGAGTWSITSAALADGSHALRATQTDAAGNVSQQGAALTVTVDTLAPAAAAAPVLAAASDSGTAGDHVTKVATPTFSGTAEAMSQVTLYDTDGQTALGSVQAGADGTWSITASQLADGAHALSIKQVDAAGNVSAASAAFTLTVDTAAPAAPGAPQLQAQSDTGTRGDGITYAMPTLEGSAAANDLVTLYDGATAVGTAHADANGHWSILAQTLHLGKHTLSVTDTDAAGNVSAASGGFVLSIVEAPDPLVDGVRVVTVPVVLPGGASGTQVDVPIVGADRAESSGAAGVADIPLASAAGTNLLVAQLATGYGLSASGGANTTVANGATGLIAAIQAATASDGGGDRGHMVGNGQSYLAQLASDHALLVDTVTPVSSAAPTGTLTLSGSTDPQQHVALVIQTAGLAPGSTIALQNVEFAAIVGAASVVARGGTQMLSGDAASQHFTLAAGDSAQVFAGGGDDTMSFDAPTTAASASGAARALAAPATTVLHGGAGDDTAVFNGARADFDIETHSDYLIVSSKAAPGAKALVVNVEHLQFADAAIAVQNGADLAPLTGLYQAVLGRQADVYGLDYWAGVHDKGTSLGAIAVNMIGSAERLATQGGFNGDVAHDVGLLYAGLFDRAADTAGLAFWAAAVQHGATLAQVADAMLQSVEMVGQQGTPLDWNFSM